MSDNADEKHRRVAAGMLENVFPVLGPKWEERFVERLREAIRRGGGNKAVSARSGVHARRIGRYLAGEGVKLDALVAIAHATGVSLDWLATGQGSPDGATPVPAAAAPAPESQLFSFVNMDLLGGALDTALHMEPPLSGRALAQIVCILYDEAKRRIAAEKEQR